MNVDVPKLLGLLGIEYRKYRDELNARCPIPGHEERDASWGIVSDEGSYRNGSWHCFGCKKSGGPVELVSLVIGITAFSAKRWLESNGVVRGDATPDSLPSRIRCEVVNDDVPILELPRGVVVGKSFKEWPEGFRKYLVKRGIGAWQVEHHGIGYGLYGEQEGRVVFPVRDQYGVLLYYTGRKIVKARIRYKSCPEQPGARPEAALFGETMWRHRGGFDEVFTTEGITKALAIERALCELGTGERGGSVAAFCGSELHEEQVVKLRRFARITHVADPDETGMRFARELEGKMCGEMGVRIVVSPNEKQADEVGRGVLRALLIGGT